MLDQWIALKNHINYKIAGPREREFVGRANSYQLLAYYQESHISFEDN